MSTNKAGHQPIQEETFAVLTRITTVEATISEAWFGTEGSICLNVWEWHQQAGENLAVLHYIEISTFMNSNVSFVQLPLVCLI